MRKNRSRSGNLRSGSKSSRDKEDYRQFIHRSRLDPTEEEESPLEETDPPRAKGDNSFQGYKSRGKSFWLKIKDNFLAGLLVALAILIISGIGRLLWIQGATSERLLTIEDKIAELGDHSSKVQEQLHLLDKNISVFRAETIKDIELIKHRLKL